MRHDSDSDSERSSDHHGGASAPAPEQRAGPAPGIPPATAAYPPQDHDATARVLDRYRVEALIDIDKAGFSLFHLKVCLVVGVGFFTDAYDIFAINMASIMLGHLHGHTTDPSSLSHRLSINQDFGIKVAAPIGNLIGQLFFGCFADTVGRKRMYGVELIIIITATFSQALAGSGPGLNIVGVLIVWRFIMGVGVAGDHPLSAVIASEFASTRSRGRLMTAVFTAQGWGNLAASCVALMMILAYKDSIISDNFNQPQHVDYCWRILIGLGCVPGAIALYFRLTIPETPRFIIDIDRDIQRAKADVENVLKNGASAGVYRDDRETVVQRAQAPRSSRRDFIRYFRRSNFKLLIGVAYSWFAIDVAFYGLGLNSSSILISTLLTRAGIGEVINQSELNATLGVYKSLHSIAIGSLVVAVAGLLPGYYASFFLIDIWGRKPIQFLGFIMLTVLLAVLAGIYPGPQPDFNEWTKAQAFVALYCLANFFTNFGPNVTTFIIPGEISPTRYRSTAHGFAAACGKLGAIVSQIILFKVHGSDKVLKAILGGIFAGITLTGIGSTWLLEETKDKSLEELSHEPQQGFISGVTPVRLQDGIVHRQGRA